MEDSTIFWIVRIVIVLLATLLSVYPIYLSRKNHLTERLPMLYATLIACCQLLMCLCALVFAVCSVASASPHDCAGYRLSAAEDVLARIEGTVFKAAELVPLR